jgi:hypothetical protein
MGEHDLKQSIGTYPKSKYPNLKPMIINVAITQIHWVSIHCFGFSKPFRT